MLALSQLLVLIPVLKLVLTARAYHDALGNRRAAQNAYVKEANKGWFANDSKLDQLKKDRNAADLTLAKWLVEYQLLFNENITGAVVTVENGKIKAIAKGTATIYVYSNNGFAKAIKVKVKYPKVKKLVSQI